MVLIGTIKGNGSGVGTFIYLDQCFIRITHLHYYHLRYDHDNHPHHVLAHRHRRWSSRWPACSVVCGSHHPVRFDNKKQMVINITIITINITIITITITITISMVLPIRFWRCQWQQKSASVLPSSWSLIRFLMMSKQSLSIVAKGVKISTDQFFPQKN